MIKKLLDHIFFKEVKQRIYLKISFVLLVMPFSFFGQVTFNEIPKDKQLVARIGNTYKGNVVIQGQVDSSSTPYESIQVNVLRNGSPYGSSYNKTLSYTGNLASFNFIISIDAELANYSFEVQGIIAGTPTTITLPTGTGNDVVAGDVYIIQGQSNAVASIQNGVASISTFVRVYASGDEDFDDLELNDEWYFGHANGGEAKDGNTGQWGAKLGSMIVASEGIPIAIFNGARGGKPIDYFLENYSGDPDPDTNNFERLKYRLNKTGLSDAVKAVFWSQGENVSNSISSYKSNFLSLRASWQNNYSSVSNIYIFQTINGCNAYYQNATTFMRLMFSKEAQRQLAEENSNIQIINTDGLVQHTDNCHFVFFNGYEGFAERIYPLVMKDFYGGGSSENDVSPNITDAYLIDDITLILQTDAPNNLSMGNEIQTAANFELANVQNSSSITGVEVSGSQIIFTLSAYPGANAKISNLGAIPGSQDNLITNGASGPEILSFYEFPISDSGITIWSSNSWTNNTPTQSINAIIDDDLTFFSTSLETKDLKINPGMTLDFDNGTNNSVVVNGNLTVEGSLTIGDTESLVIKNVSSEVVIDGTFTKKERTTTLESKYDVTYWSSSVESLNVGTAFPGVDPNRIFYMDQTDENPIYTGNYYRYRHWFIAGPSTSMTPGMGFSVDGNSSGSYPNRLEVSFEGKPNYKDISINIYTDTPSSDDANLSNLVGNPYPAAINADQLIQANSSKFKGTLYLWSHNTDYISGEYLDADYLTYNLSGSNNSDIGSPYYIASGQGFMILANGNGIFNFENSMQVANENDQFFKSNEKKKNNSVDKKKDRMWLALVKDGTKRKEILIGFTKNASEGIDFGYDGKLLNEDAPLNFYSLIESEKFVIQGQSSFTRARTIKLGFDSNEAIGNFTIGISKIEGKLKNAHVYLEDKVLNITHDLKKSAYTFEQTEAGTNPDRFVLKFNNRAPIGRDNNHKNNFKVYKTRHGSIAIRSDQIINKVRVYDIYGRLLMAKNVNSKTTKLNTGKIRKGTVLIIEVVFENGDVVRKKTIKY